MVNPSNTRTLAIEPTSNIKSIRLRIAEIIHDYMDIPMEITLADTPFSELHKDFDSLAMIELQLLLEKEYRFEFQTDVHNADKKTPNNITELAQQLLEQYINNSTKIQ